MAIRLGTGFRPDLSCAQGSRELLENVEKISMFLSTYVGECQELIQVIVLASLIPGREVDELLDEGVDE